MKPYFSDKGAVKTDITLIEGNEIVQEDISLLPVVSKIFVKLMQAQISGYMEIFFKSVSVWVSEGL